MADFSVTWDHSRSSNFLVLVFALEVQWCHHVNALTFQGTISKIFKHIRGSGWLRCQCWSLLEKWNFQGKRGIYSSWSSHSASAENLGGHQKTIRWFPGQLVFRAKRVRRRGHFYGAVISDAFSSTAGDTSTRSRCSFQNLFPSVMDWVGDSLLIHMYLLSTMRLAKCGDFGEQTLW